MTIDKHILYLIGFLIFTVSCEKEEVPYTLPPKPSDSVRVYQINLGEKYEDQVFINFNEQNLIQASVKSNCWDISLDCNPGVQHIYINGGKGIFVTSVGKGKFQNIDNPASLKWKWDASSGGDSIVIKNWCNRITRQNTDSIYVIDRGVDVDPDKRYYQFKIYNSLLPECVELYIADVHGNFISKVILEKDDEKEQVYFDFEQRKVLNFQPKYNRWQFCFLRCRWVYYEFNPPLVYTVTGIHINTRTTEVFVDSTMAFESINRKMAEGYKYSSSRDVIGFNWKMYDFDKGQYIARKYVNYIIKLKGRQPAYYKLRFTDFYSKEGLKGSPKFEIVGL